MIFHFDLVNLRLFLNVVDAGSITAGAGLSKLSLAAASERIADMETVLATPLLNRSRRGVQATAAGETLATHARGVLAQADRLRQDMQGPAPVAKVCITLAGTSAAIREYLPEVLGAFLAEHRQVNVSTTELDGHQAVAAVRESRIDIAFISEHIDPGGLETHPLRVDRFALVVPRGHPLVAQAAGRPMSIASSDGCDVVGLPEGSRLQDTWEARALERGAPLNYRVRVPGFDAQVRLIERGMGVALMPEATARRFARTRAIDFILLSDAFLVRRLLIAVRQLSALPPHSQELIRRLRSTHVDQPEAHGTP